MERLNNKRLLHTHGDPHSGHGHSGHTHMFDPSAGDYLNKAFIFGIGLNLIFVAVEFIAGLILDSVALMSDAGHNLSDVVSLALSLLAFRLARQKPTARYTYGRKKSTVVVSLANACILLIAIGVILVESIEKLRNPQPVAGGAIAWVAGVGIVINALTAWLFIRHKNNDLNVKGAYLHMAADTLVSVGVLVSGLVIQFTGWYIIDPVIGILIAVVIFISTWGLLKDSIRLSLDGVPPGVDLAGITEVIRSADPRVREVHHVHIWALSTTENALTAHVVVDTVDGSEQVKHNIKQELREHGIGHSTLELEQPGEMAREHCEGCD